MGMRRYEMLCLFITRLIGVFLIIEALISAPNDTMAKDAPSGPSFNVGYRVLDFKYLEGAQEKTLTVAVWYPTKARPKPYNYGGPTTGMVAVDADPLAEGGPFPMLVFSHGCGGSGLGAVFLTERLAAYGWIVATPDHNDKFCAVRIRSGRVKDFDRQGLLQEAENIASAGPDERHKYLYRLDEMKLVIDRMIAADDFQSLIDTSRIAVGGHSFGGYTALGLCGTIRERLDARIRAVLLFSTGAGSYMFTEGELSRVKVPSMLLMGERERRQLRGSHTMLELSNRIYRNLSPPKYFLEVKGANHFSFNNDFGDNPWGSLLSGSEEQFEVIRRYAIPFLEKYAATRQDPGHVLENGHPMLTRYQKDAPSDTSIKK